MKDDRPYHSAIAANDAAIECPEVYMTKQRNGVAAVWDIMEGHELPAIYERCDLIYSEPAWPSGLSNFMERVGKDGPTFKDYMARIRWIVETANKPTAMVVGKTALSYMPETKRVIPVSLNGGRALIAFWNGAYADGVTNDDVIRDLAKQYNIVGDFSCGYGNTGRIFQAAGKSYVLTDVNPKCIGYIYDHAEGWG